MRHKDVLRHHEKRRTSGNIHRQMPRPADYLLIDMSNSFTKVAFASQNRVERAERIATDRLTSQVIGKWLRRRGVETIVVSSVVPAKSRVIRGGAKGRRILWVSARIPFGVAIDYPKP